MHFTWTDVSHDSSEPRRGRGTTFRFRQVSQEKALFLGRLVLTGASAIDKKQLRGRNGLAGDRAEDDAPEARHLGLLLGLLSATHEGKKVVGRTNSRGTALLSGDGGGVLQRTAVWPPVVRIRWERRVATTAHLAGHPTLRTWDVKMVWASTVCLKNEKSALGG